ncbi:GNAT family N-acetyltransferase [Microbacterium sp. B2969]|uniref:GNAT family N-acetyltransferase n=1 Tax=Microbacterium alkaliflavum TaxID=3248839 RepID=A0ABW7Q7L2_9MICO
MPDRTSLTVRAADLDGPDATAVGRLVGDYLQQTEREKAEHLRGAAPTGDLPAAYRREVEDPRTAFAACEVFVAEVDAAPVGVAIVKHDGDAVEIKRLWADPSARGRGVGSALLDTVLADRAGVVRLSVWEWRHGAARLYVARGFTQVPSWDARDQLVCMEWRRP